MTNTNEDCRTVKNLGVFENKFVVFNPSFFNQRKISPTCCEPLIKYDAGEEQ
jgi:hypothetical protein